MITEPMPTSQRLQRIVLNMPEGQYGVYITTVNDITTPNMIFVHGTVIHEGETKKVVKVRGWDHWAFMPEEQEARDE